jgi:histone deacetylase complex regulatory component SIN3
LTAPCKTVVRPPQCDSGACLDWGDRLRLPPPPPPPPPPPLQQQHPSHAGPTADPQLQHQQQLDQQGGGAANTNARRQLKVEDALAYLEQVKSQFEGKPNVYNRFLDIMKEFKAQSINTTEVIRRVSQLFSGHRTLILGFNTFLPPGYKIEIRENAQGVLSTGFSGPGGFSELPQQPKATDGSPFPPGLASRPAAAAALSAGPSAASRTAAGAASAARAGHTLSSATKRRPVASPHRKRAAPAAAASASAAEFVPPAPPLSAPAVPGRAGPGLSRGAGGAGGGVFDAAAVGGYGDGRVDPCLGVSLPARPADMDLACHLFEQLKQRGLTHRDLDVIVDHLTKTIYTSPTPPTTDALVSSILEFIGDGNKDALLACLKHVPTPVGAPAAVMEGASKRVGGRGAAPRRVAASVGTDTSKGRRVPAAAAGRSRAPGGRADGNQFFEDARRELGGPHEQLYLDFIKCISLFSHEIVTRDELVLMSADLLRDKPDVHQMFLQHLDSAILGVDDGRRGADSSGSSIAGGPPGGGQTLGEHRAEMFKSKPISEIAAESKIACSSSYKKLPSDYPALACSGRSALEKRTVNDTWVSVTTGSEDYSFRFMRKNAFEDNLFRCEDDRYELDLVIETNASTIHKLEPIAATIAKLPPGVKQRHFLAEGALSAINFSAIQRIYGESGPDIVQHVKLNPAVAVPVVLARLRDKDEHWRRARVEMNAVWRDVGEKNYHRSLDHRSAHFKQVDKKELSSKSLIADIMNPAASHAARHAEMTRARGYASAGGGPNDRSPAADAVAMLSALGQTDAVPSLELPYQEAGVHRVVFSLVSNSILAGARDDASDASKATLASYRQFVHAFFGVNVDEEVPASAAAGPADGDVTQVVMYGDESIYLFFRLHHLVFERLTAAKQLAAESAADLAFRKKCNELGRLRVRGKPNMPVLRSAPSDLTRDLQSGSGPDAAPFQLNGCVTDPDELFDEFLLLLREFLAGALDLGKYEDRCRVLLGADSYSLSTMDKTLSKLCKQVSLVFSPDAVTSVFLSLFHTSRDSMEAAKTDGNQRGVEDLYTIAATSALRKARGPGSSLFRLQHVRRRASEDQLVIHVVGRTTT